MNLYKFITRCLTWNDIRPLTNEERKARWAMKYYGGGYDRSEP
jgi:hypothetical protein